jgi:hypothetical protein
VPYTIDNGGNGNPYGACTGSVPTSTVYAAPGNTVPIVGLILYTNQSLTTPFVGGAGYRKLVSPSVTSYAAVVDTNGQITDYSTCASITTTTTTTSTTTTTTTQPPYVYYVAQRCDNIAFQQNFRTTGTYSAGTSLRYNGYCWEVQTLQGVSGVDAESAYINCASCNGTFPTTTTSTTTTSTTQAPVNASVSSSCTGITQTITVNNFTGGDGSTYYASNTTYGDPESAANGPVSPVAGGTVDYAGQPNGTRYIKITSTISQNVVSGGQVCTTTTTTTTSTTTTTTTPAPAAYDYYLANEFDCNQPPCSTIRNTGVPVAFPSGFAYIATRYYQPISQDGKLYKITGPNSVSTSLILSTTIPSGTNCVSLCAL